MANKLFYCFITAIICLKINEFQSFKNVFSTIEITNGSAPYAVEKSFILFILISVVIKLFCCSYRIIGLPASVKSFMTVLYLNYVTIGIIYSGGQSILCCPLKSIVMPIDSFLWYVGVDSCAITMQLFSHETKFCISH